jgi:hypothetical protein
MLMAALQFIAAVGKRQASANATLWSQVSQNSRLQSDFGSAMRLFEILHRLPEIMKQGEDIGLDADAQVQDMETTKELLNLFVLQCQDFEMRLVEWCDDLGAHYESLHRVTQASPGPFAWTLGDTLDPDLPSLYWFAPSTLYSRLPPDSPHRIFPFFICFADPDVAYQVVLHWTGLLLMHSTMLALLGRLHAGKDHTLAARLAKSTSPKDARSLALLIAQSLEYFVHPDIGQMGTNLIGFPLSVTQRFFQHSGSKEILWLEVIFQRIREMRSGLGGFLDDMAKGNTVKLASPWQREVR